MNRKVFETIQQYEMIQQGDSVCVALSGGADSVALLAFFLRNRDTLKISVSACHLNHNLRGEESERDARVVRDLCCREQVPLFYRSEPVGQLAQEKHLSVEEAARNVRYQFFEEIAYREHCKIATAHTLSDSMETIVFNLARGTGIKGLLGIPPKRGDLIRPLIQCTRQDVEAYCEQYHLDYVTDSTNLSDDYTRNLIRHQVIPRLYSINPAADRAFLRTIRFMGEADQLVEQLARQALESWQTQYSQWYPVHDFLELPSAVAHRVFSILASHAHVATSTEQYDLCLDLLRRGKGAQQLTQSVFFTVGSNGFAFLKKETQEKVDFTQKLEALSPGKQVFCAVGRNRTACLELLDCEQIKNFQDKKSKGLKNVLDYDRIYGTVIIRPRLSGDAIRLPGRGCTKSLKKLFQEKKVPVSCRESIPVLQDDTGIIWVETFGPSERTAVSNQTTRFLMITILED